jgi:hypothetical protein
MNQQPTLTGRPTTNPSRLSPHRSLDLGVNTAGAIGRMSAKEDHVELDIKGLK